MNFRKSIRYAIYLFVFIGLNAVNAGSFDDFFRAIRQDYESAITALLKRGFDPNTRDEKGRPGLILAIQEEAPKAVNALLASPKINVELRNNADESALMLAALQGDANLAKRLIARGGNVNKTGWTPLHYAATNGHVPVIKLLLEEHAYIDAESPNGTTPLMMAASYGSFDAVKLLLAEGADAKLKNQLNLTAVDFASRADRNDIVKLLRTHTQPRKPTGSW